MTIISMEAKIAELEAQLEESKKQLMLLKENYISGEPVGRWKPQEGDQYFAICADGEITTFHFNKDYDLKMFRIGNCFKTLVEAEFVKERLIVINELHQFSESRDRYWGDEQCKHYSLMYDYVNDEIIISVSCHNTFGVIYFGSEEAANQAINTVGKERLKKYYFGVRRG